MWIPHVWSYNSLQHNQTFDIPVIQNLIRALEKGGATLKRSKGLQGRVFLALSSDQSIDPTMISSLKRAWLVNFILFSQHWLISNPTHT
jgi:hypothetical protein